MCEYTVWLGAYFSAGIFWIVEQKRRVFPTYSHAGFRPRLACQFWSHASSFLALLLSPCWPIICRIFIGLYLSTHSKDSGVMSETARMSGLCVSCVDWLSWVCGVVVVVSLPCKRSIAFTALNGVTDTCSNTHNQRLSLCSTSCSMQNKIISPTRFLTVLKKPK